MSIGHIERAWQVLGVPHRTLRRLRDDRGVSKYARIQEAQNNVYRARHQLMDQLDDPYNLKNKWVKVGPFLGVNPWLLYIIKVDEVS